MNKAYKFRIYPDEEQRILIARTFQIRINKYFPSSQLCSVCGYQNPDTKYLSVREWICPCCQTHHSKDVNAAVNIRNEGMRIALS